MPVNYTAMMFLDIEPPITAGREIWGFPKRWGQPDLRVEKDTLTGTLAYAGQRVAMGTMVYKHDTLCDDPARDCAAKLAKTAVNLKLIPCVTGKPRIAELVAFEMTDITCEKDSGAGARGCIWCRMSTRRWPPCRCAG